MREAGIETAQEPGRLMRLGRQDHRVRLHHRPFGGDEPPAPFAPLHLDHALLEAHHAGREPLRQGVDELLHAVGEGEEKRPARATHVLGGGGRRAARPPHAEDHAPVAALHLEEARHGGGEREGVGIGGVDAPDERLGHALERLAAEPAAHEGAQALIGIATPRQHEVQRHAGLAAPGEER